MLPPHASLAIPEVRSLFPEVHLESLPPVERVQATFKNPDYGLNQDEKDLPERQPQSIERNTHPLVQELAGQNSELSIALDAKTNKIVVKILNSETKEVIKQIPPEELLELAESLKQIGGALVDEVA